jgi:hypothetical protein
MHFMDDKLETPETHGGERPKIPLHPGCGILRRAVRANIVSFPSQIPIFPKRPQAEMQWRMVLLFFVRGWSAANIAERFHVPNHRVWSLLNAWSVRAMALGHVQVIDAEAFEACCRGEVECGIDDGMEAGRLGTVRPLVGNVPHALPRAALDMGAGGAWRATRASGGSAFSPGEGAGLIAALDSAVAHCEEWRGEFWVRAAAHLRDLRTATLAALEVGRTSERRDAFFITSQSGNGSLTHEPLVRGEERVSHAVA